jgi:flagellar basal body-associated protein FliL
MSQEAVEQPVESAPTPAPKSKAGLLSLIKAIAFVSVIVIVEIVAASMLVPSAEETEKLGHELVAAARGSTSHAEEEEASGDHDEIDHDVREVKLGTYNITRFNPASSMTRAIDFELFGTVIAEDLTEFEHLFENSKARIREQVIMTLHGAESSDLTDAGLGLLKRRILEKTNRALGQPLLREVLFSKFNFVER